MRAPSMTVPAPSQPAATAAEIRRLATQIALAYAGGHNQQFQSFSDAFRTAYRGLASCTEPARLQQYRKRR